MRTRLLFAALPLAATVAFAFACSTPADDGENSEGAQSVSNDRVVEVGTCHLASAPSSTTGVLPPPEASRYIGNVDNITTAQVLTDVRLMATIQTRNGKRIIQRLTGMASRGAASGDITIDLKFAPLATHKVVQLANGTSGVDDIRSIVGLNGNLLASDAMLNTADAGTSDGGASTVDKLTLGNTSENIAWLEMSRAEGKSWLTFTGPNGKFVATAPGCTFNDKAWTLLQEVRCESQLYASTASDAGAVCTGGSQDGGSADAATASDAAAAPDASDGGSVVVVTDAGQPTVDAGNGASTTTASNASDYGSGASQNVGSNDGEGNPSSTESGDGLATKPAKKKASADSGGCSVGTWNPSSGAGSLGIAGFALAVLARRRRARR